MVNVIERTYRLENIEHKKSKPFRGRACFWREVILCVKLSGLSFSEQMYE